MTRKVLIIPAMASRRRVCLERGVRDPAESMPKRWLVLALAVWVACSVLLFDPKPDTGGDNAVYLALAESIATGQGYRDLHIAGAPAHSQYPAGFPVLLSLLRLSLGHTSVLAAKLLVWVFSFGAAWLVALVFGRLLGRRGWTALFVLVSLPVMLRAGHQVLTEMPFLCVSLGALICALKAEDGHPRWHLAAVLLAAGSLLLRTAGIGLVAGLGLALASRRHWRWLVLLVALTAAVAVPFQLRGAAAGQGGTYLEMLLARHPYIAGYGRMGPLDFAARVWGNFTSYAFIVVPETLVPLLDDLAPPAITAVIGGLLLVLVLLGLRTRLRRPSALDGYALTGGAVLLAWPDIWAGERFLVPLLPLLVVYLFLGLEWLAGRFRARGLVMAVAVLLLLLNGTAVVVRATRTVPANRQYLRGDRYSGYPLEWRRFFDVLDRVRTDVPPGAVVMARKPEFVWLWTRHESLCYPFTDTREMIRAAVDRADYIVFDNFRWTRTTRDFLNPVLQEDPSRYPVVFETEPPQFYLLKVAGVRDPRPGTRGGSR